MIKLITATKIINKINQFEGSERIDYLLKRIEEALTNLDAIPKSIMNSQKNTDYYKLLRNLKKTL